MQYDTIDSNNKFILKVGDIFAVFPLPFLFLARIFTRIAHVMKLKERLLCPLRSNRCYLKGMLALKKIPQTVL